jgi:hypothetical protein
MNSTQRSAAQSVADSEFDEELEAKKQEVLDELSVLSPIDERVEDDEEFKATAYAHNVFAINEEKL